MRGVLAAFLCIGLLSAPIPEEEAYLFIGMRGVIPTPMHVAIKSMILGCLGRDKVEYPVAGWGIADQIVHYPTGVLAYGITVYDESTHTSLIVIERRYWLHPSVVSHEVIHAVTGYREEEFGTAERMCEMGIPGGLDLRPPVPPDSLAVLQRLAGGGS